MITTHIHFLPPILPSLSIPFSLPLFSLPLSLPLHPLPILLLLPSPSPFPLLFPLSLPPLTNSDLELHPDLYLPPPNKFIGE